MKGLLPDWWKYALVAVLVGGVVWMVQGSRLASLERDHAVTLEKLANATVASVEAARAEEGRRTAAVEESRDIAKAQYELASADAAAGVVTADRLRDELAALRRRGTSCNPAPANGSPATADPLGLLIDVLTGVEQAGRELAEYTDRARIAGAACERAYDGVRLGK